MPKQYMKNQITMKENNMNTRIKKKHAKATQMNKMNESGYRMSDAALSVYAFTGFQSWLPFYLKHKKRYHACINAAIKTNACVR